MQLSLFKLKYHILNDCIILYTRTILTNAEFKDLKILHLGTCQQNRNGKCINF